MAYDPNNPTPNTAPNAPRTVYTTNTTNVPPAAPPRSGTSLPLIIGGLVVLVAIIAYFVFGTTTTDNATVTGSQPAAVETAPAAGTAPTSADPVVVDPVPGTDATGAAVPGETAPAAPATGN